MLKSLYHNKSNAEIMADMLRLTLMKIWNALANKDYIIKTNDLNNN